MWLGERIYRKRYRKWHISHHHGWYCCCFSKCNLNEVTLIRENVPRGWLSEIVLMGIMFGIICFVVR